MNVIVVEIERGKKGVTGGGTRVWSGHGRHVEMCGKKRWTRPGPEIDLGEGVEDWECGQLRKRQRGRRRGRRKDGERRDK